MIKLSVITVVYNNFNYIEDTVLNVLNVKGNHKDIEYIIIDGGSTDGTVDIIKKYQDKITLWVSELDKGIYDAMNKGVVLAKGEWLIFMNSGDSFYNSEQSFLNNILFNTQGRQDYDIIYGNTLTKNEGKIITIPLKKVNANFFFLNTICNQSVFFNRKVFNTIGYYNLDYKIISDRDLLFRVANTNGKFGHLDCIISVWDEEGFSKDNVSLFKKEEDLFKKHNFTKIERNYILLKTRFVNLIKKILQ
jgi:glycosyltransferase involved in cell wall biosynthesis